MSPLLLFFRRTSVGDVAWEGSFLGIDENGLRLEEFHVIARDLRVLWSRVAFRVPESILSPDLLDRRGEPRIGSFFLFVALAR